MSKLTTYKLVRFESQELLDLGCIITDTFDNKELVKELLIEYGITEDRLGDLALKLKKAIDGLEG